jgi:hypothetical protein
MLYCSYHNPGGKENIFLQRPVVAAIKDLYCPLCERCPQIMKTFLAAILGGVILLTQLGSVGAAADKPQVLFDQGHNQRFVIEDKGELQLSRLAGIIGDNGAAVSAIKAQLSEETLKSARALVISGAFQNLDPAEIDAVAGFVERGGRLAVMLHIGAPLSGLLERLDVDHSNVVLHERNNVIDTDINFRVTNLAATPLFAGMSHFSLYGGWALNPGKSATALAFTSPEAWADMDGNKVLSKGDVVGDFAVVVSGTFGAGSFVVFGDDAIFQNRYLDEQNSRLAANLGNWLLGR